jgi:F5/8 type C domain
MLLKSAHPPASLARLARLIDLAVLLLAAFASQPCVASANTLYWFAPLPPMPERPGRQYTGSDDFMDLFLPDAPWQTAAHHIQVFKLYGEWVHDTATDEQLKQVVVDLRRRGIALGVEGGPLKARDCGAGIEGFAESGWDRIADRIKAAGGTIDYIDMDEPYYYAHFYNGPRACHRSVSAVAHELAAFIKTLREKFPNVVIGDAEPLVGQADAAVYQAWIDAFKKINGFALPFLHMDVDWSRRAWPQEVNSIEEHGRSAGVAVGIVYSGNEADPTDAAWLANAGERVKRYELDAGGRPDHVLFQSWHDKPDHLLPETAEFTFTHFIDRYFTDKARLGYASSAGRNLAYGKNVTASGVDGEHVAANAVDGNPQTFWSAGGFPPQQIEVDLGRPYDIKSVRLITSQSPAGPTTHEVYGKGPGTKGAWQLLRRFQGNTADGEDLDETWPRPVTGVEWIRVATTRSPSWVGWREIEIIGAEARR